MSESPELLPEVIPPPASEAGEDAPSEDNKEFEERVSRLLELVAEDSGVRDRMLAEMYVTIAEFQASFREMQDNVQKMGPRAMFKSMFGKDKE